MEKLPVYTIGHGIRKAEDFLGLLKKYSIEFLVDVRSVPHSRFNPQYNQKSLKAFLEKNGIAYIFMGDALGGRPDDPSCYTSSGKPDYTVMKKKDFFLKGISRLKKAYEKNIPLAIMCSESKPQDCHRCRLIGQSLVLLHIPVAHIDEQGKLADQASVIRRIKKVDPGINLFSGGTEKLN